MILFLFSLFYVGEVAGVSSIPGTFDTVSFSKTALGTYYPKLTHQEKKAFEEWIWKRVEQRLFKKSWTTIESWKETTLGMSAKIQNDENETVHIELLRSKKSPVFRDVTFNGHSLLINVASTLQKALRKHPPQKVIEMLQKQSVNEELR